MDAPQDALLLEGHQVAAEGRLRGLEPLAERREVGELLALEDPAQLEPALRRLHRPTSRHEPPVGVVDRRRRSRLVGRDLERAAHDVARLGERADVAEGQRLHEDVAGGGGLDRSRHDRAAGGVGRELAQQPVAGAAARRCAGARAAGRGCLPSARGRSGTSRPGCRGRCARSRPSTRAPAGRSGGSTAWIRAGMSPGAANAGSSTSTSERNAGAAAAISTRRSYDSVSPWRPQWRRHSWTSHRPHRFFRKRIVPPTPPSFVKLAARLALADAGRGDLGAEQRPGPRAEVGEALVARPAPRRPRAPCRGRRPRSPAASAAGPRPRRPRGAAGRRAPCPARRSRRRSRSAATGARGERWPTARSATSRHCDVVAIVYSFAMRPAEPEGEEVRHHQQVPSRLEGGRAALPGAAAAGRAC